MSRYLEIKKVGKYTVKIVQDDSPMNPRTECDHLCTMICFHRHYNLGDKHDFTPDSLKKLVSRRDIYSLPIYLYDHSGITMNTTGFSCRWDSGQVGYIYISRKDFMDVFGYKKMTKKAKEHVYDCLRAEVKEYDNYLTGEVYGYMVDDAEGYTVDSCFGFNGEIEDCMKEGISSAEYQIKYDIKEHVAQVKIWIKNRVPFEHRTPLSI